MINLNRLPLPNAHPIAQLLNPIEATLNVTEHLPIKGSPSYDIYLKKLKSEEQAAWTNFPQKMTLWTQAELKRIIETVNADLPSDVKKVPYGKGFLIRRPAGEEHTELLWTNTEGKVLKKAVVQNTELPEVVVVDGFLEKILNFIVTHGDLVTTFIREGNPFVKILKKNIQIESLDEKGNIIYRLPLEKALNAFQNISKKKSTPKC
jgi:hypothetical protein